MPVSWGPPWTASVFLNNLSQPVQLLLSSVRVTRAGILSRKLQEEPQGEEMQPTPSVQEVEKLLEKEMEGEEMMHELPGR